MYCNECSCVRVLCVACYDLIVESCLLSAGMCLLVIVCGVLFVVVCVFDMRGLPFIAFCRLLWLCVVSCAVRRLCCAVR